MEKYNKISTINTVSVLNSLHTTPDISLKWKTNKPIDETKNKEKSRTNQLGGWLGVLDPRLHNILNFVYENAGRSDSL